MAVPAPAELVGTRIKLLWAFGGDEQDEWWEGTLAPVTVGPHVGIPGWFFCRYDKDADKYDRGADVVLDDDHDVFIMLRADEMMRATTQQVVDDDVEDDDDDDHRLQYLAVEGDGYERPVELQEHDVERALAALRGSPPPPPPPQAPPPQAPPPQF